MDSALQHTLRTADDRPLTSTIPSRRPGTSVEKPGRPATHARPKSFNTDHGQPIRERTPHTTRLGGSRLRTYECQLYCKPSSARSHQWQRIEGGCRTFRCYRTGVKRWREPLETARRRLGKASSLIQLPRLLRSAALVTPRSTRSRETFQSSRTEGQEKGGASCSKGQHASK